MPVNSDHIFPTPMGIRPTFFDRIDRLFE